MISISNSQPLAHLVCKFVFEGTTYDVDGFSTGFHQPTSALNGKPQHEMQGGQMSILLSQIPDSSLKLWAKKETSLKGGLVLFQADSGMTVMEIEFSNAYCIDLSRGLSSLNNSSVTVIISPQIVKIYGIPLKNDWGVTV